MGEDVEAGAEAGVDIAVRTTRPWVEADGGKPFDVINVMVAVEALSKWVALRPVAGTFFNGCWFHVSVFAEASPTLWVEWASTCAIDFLCLAVFAGHYICGGSSRLVCDSSQDQEE